MSAEGGELNCCSSGEMAAESVDDGWLDVHFALWLCTICRQLALVTTQIKTSGVVSQESHAEKY